MLPAIMAPSIPIVAIVGSLIIKAKKLKVQSLSTQERKQIQQLIQENNELRTRIGHLETIVAEVDLDYLKLKAPASTDKRLDR